MLLNRRHFNSLPLQILKKCSSRMPNTASSETSPYTQTVRTPDAFMNKSVRRESSFNMTSGGGGGHEDIEGELRKFLDTRKGVSEIIKGGAAKICIL